MNGLQLLIRNLQAHRAKRALGPGQARLGIWELLRRVSTDSVGAQRFLPPAAPNPQLPWSAGAHDQRSTASEHSYGTWAALQSTQQCRLHGRVLQLGGADGWASIAAAQRTFASAGSEPRAGKSAGPVAPARGRSGPTQCGAASQGRTAPQDRVAARIQQLARDITPWCQQQAHQGIVTPEAAVAHVNHVVWQLQDAIRSGLLATRWSTVAKPAATGKTAAPRTAAAKGRSPQAVVQAVDPAAQALTNALYAATAYMTAVRLRFDRYQAAGAAKLVRQLVFMLLEVQKQLPVAQRDAVMAAVLQALEAHSKNRGAVPFGQAQQPLAAWLADIATTTQPTDQVRLLSAYLDAFGSVPEGALVPLAARFEQTLRGLVGSGERPGWLLQPIDTRLLALGADAQLQQSAGQLPPPGPASMGVAVQSGSIDTGAGASARWAVMPGAPSDAAVQPYEQPRHYTRLGSLYIDLAKLHGYSIAQQTGTAAESAVTTAQQTGTVPHGSSAPHVTAQQGSSVARGTLVPQGAVPARVSPLSGSLAQATELAARYTEQLPVKDLCALLRASAQTEVQTPTLTRAILTQVLARQHQLTATQIVSVMQALASLVPTRKTRNPTDWGAFGDSLSTRPVTLFDQSRRVIDMGLSASAFVGVQSRFTEAVGGLLARLGRLCVLRADNQTLGALLACVEVVGSMVLPGTGASPLSDTEVQKQLVSDLITCINKEELGPIQFRNIALILVDTERCSGAKQAAILQQQPLNPASDMLPVRKPTDVTARAWSELGLRWLAFCATKDVVVSLVAKSDYKVAWSMWDVCLLLTLFHERLPTQRSVQCTMAGLPVLYVLSQQPALSAPVLRDAHAASVPWGDMAIISQQQQVPPLLLADYYIAVLLPPLLQACGEHGLLAQTSMQHTPTHPRPQQPSAPAGITPAGHQASQLLLWASKMLTIRLSEMTRTLEQQNRLEREQMEQERVRRALEQHSGLPQVDKEAPVDARALREARMAAARATRDPVHTPQVGPALLTVWMTAMTLLSPLLSLAGVRRDGDPTKRFMRRALPRDIGDGMRAVLQPLPRALAAALAAGSAHVALLEGAGTRRLQRLAHAVHAMRVMQLNTMQDAGPLLHEARDALSNPAVVRMWLRNQGPTAQCIHAFVITVQCLHRVGLMPPELPALALASINPAALQRQCEELSRQPVPEVTPFGTLSETLPCLVTTINILLKTLQPYSPAVSTGGAGGAWDSRRDSSVIVQPMQHVRQAAVSAWANALAVDSPSTAELMRMVRMLSGTKRSVLSAAQGSNTRSDDPIACLWPLEQTLAYRLEQVLPSLDLKPLAALLRDVQGLRGLAGGPSVWDAVFKAGQEVIPEKLNEMYTLKMRDLSDALTFLSQAGLASDTVVKAVLDGVAFRLEEVPPGQLVHLVVALAETVRAAQRAEQGSAEGVLRVTGYLMDDVTDWLMRRLELLNVSNLVTLLPAAAGMTNARRRQLMHKLVEALREEVPKLRPDQMVSIIDALGVARVLDTHFYLAAAERIRQDANAYTGEQVYACVVAMHAAGCTHTPVYDALIAALRAKGALSAASATATAAPPTRSLLSRVTGLLTGHTQEQPTHTTTDSMSQQSSKGPRKQAHARASQAQPGDDALTDHGAEAIVEPKTRAKRSKHVVTTALVPVAKRSGREASVARRGGAQTQHQAGVPSERGRPLSLWQLQSLCGILRSVKHPEAQAVQEEFVRLALSEEGGPDTRTQPEKKQLDV